MDRSDVAGKNPINSFASAWPSWPAKLSWPFAFLLVHDNSHLYTRHDYTRKIEHRSTAITNYIAWGWSGQEILCHHRKRLTSGNTTPSVCFPFLVPICLHANNTRKHGDFWRFFEQIYGRRKFSTTLGWISDQILTASMPSKICEKFPTNM